MSKVYIEVPENEPWPKLPWFLKILTLIIPAANPDFDPLYPKVRFWLLEVSVAEGLPQREIGLDIDRKPIVAGPIGRNYGVWVDGPSAIDWKQYAEIEEALFTKLWQVMVTRYPAVK